jgi:hypothetical protein
VGKQEGKSPFGTSKLRSKDNIRMDLREIKCCGMDWINVD